MNNMPSTAKQLVAELRQKGISNELVLDAIEATPRHLFVDPSLNNRAYHDRALGLSHSQTISQPFVVARMTELLLGNRRPIQKVLEIGTGSGYQAAVLAQLIAEVYTVERIYPLYVKACRLFHQLNLNNIFTQYGDGNTGWPERAPFEGIIVTAAAQDIPEVLVEQLADGGHMVVPVGTSDSQMLYLIRREGHKVITERLDPVIFVPLLLGTESE